jgi:hypothetical protein
VLHPIRFFTRTNDPARYRFEAKTDGKHYLLVKSQDAEIRASSRHFYRVSIAPEQPDFRLIVMPPDDRRPGACRLLRGGEQFFHVLVWRTDGFDEGITLTAEGLPAGVSAPPQAVGPKQKQAEFVVSAAAKAALGVYEFKIVGTATIKGQTVVREARPATVTWPIQPGQQIPTLTRLDRSLVLAVNDQAPFHLSATLDSDAVLQGAKANVTLKLTRLAADFKTPVQVAIPQEQPPNRRTPPEFTVPATTMAPGKDEAKVAFDVRANTTPGTYTLVLRATAPVPYSKDPAAKTKPNINIILPATPLTFNVVPKELAKLQLPQASLAAKPGTDAAVAVKVARQAGYTGALKLELVLPANTKGISAEAVTIPAGQDEGKLIVKIAPDAAASYPNLVVRATALYNGKVPVPHDAKLTIAVAKK